MPAIISRGLMRVSAPCAPRRRPTGARLPVPGWRLVLIQYRVQEPAGSWWMWPSRTLAGRSIPVRRLIPAGVALGGARTGVLCAVKRPKARCPGAAGPPARAAPDAVRMGRFDVAGRGCVRHAAAVVARSRGRMRSQADPPRCCRGAGVLRSESRRSPSGCASWSQSRPAADGEAGCKYVFIVRRFCRRGLRSRCRPYVSDGAIAGRDGGAHEFLPCRAAGRGWRPVGRGEGVWRA